MLSSDLPKCMHTHFSALAPEQCYLFNSVNRHEMTKVLASEKASYYQ